jgi:ferredoxin
MTTTPETAPPPPAAAAAPPAADLVDLTIDGPWVSVPKGTLIIRAAEQAGIEIPRFCDHPGLDPVGACRQCLVEVVDAGSARPDGTPGEPTQMQGPPGRMKPQASCTMTVAPGMVVKTQYTSAGADKAQQGVMEFLLINHPLDCPVCDKGGECPLQNQAMSNGRATSRFEDIKRTYPKPINISSQVLLDRERCVLCARCTRFSDQIAGDPFIALVERGALQQVGIYEEQPFESYFSGNTVQICPVGALTGAAYRFRSRPFDLVSTPSACEHCASGLRLRTDHRRGTVLRRMAINDPAVNEEWNCDKGRWAFAYTPPSVTASSSRWCAADGELKVVSWPEALAAAAAGLQGATASGVLVGGPRQRRGRLRLRQVRPRGPRHQRRRLPRPSALGRGARLPRLARRRDVGPRVAPSPTPTSRRPAPSCSSASSPRTRARSSSCGCARPSARTRRRVRRGPLRHARPGQGRGHPDPDRPGTETEVLASAGGRFRLPTSSRRPLPRCVRTRSSSSASGSPRCPVRSVPSRNWPRPPVPGWPGCLVGR